MPAGKSRSLKMAKEVENWKSIFTKPWLVALVTGLFTSVFTSAFVLIGQHFFVLREDSITRARDAQLAASVRLAEHFELKAREFIVLGTEYGDSLESVLTGQRENVDDVARGAFAANIVEQLSMIDALERQYGERREFQEYSQALTSTRAAMPLFDGSASSLQPFWQNVANAVAAQRRVLEVVSSESYQASEGSV